MDDLPETPGELAPDPSVDASTHALNLVGRAKSALNGAAEFARQAADEAKQLPSESIDLLEESVDALKGEIKRLRHAIKPPVGADPSERSPE